MSGTYPTTPEFRSMNFASEQKTLTSTTDSGKMFSVQVDGQRFNVSVFEGDVQNIQVAQPVQQVVQQAPVQAAPVAASTTAVSGTLATSSAAIVEISKGLGCSASETSLIVATCSGDTAPTVAALASLVAFICNS